LESEQYMHFYFPCFRVGTTLKDSPSKRLPVKLTPEKDELSPYLSGVVGRKIPADPNPLFTQNV